ncbi:MAG: catechol 2,3-dioxygenase [Alphaproteobacteria bacterium]
MTVNGVLRLGEVALRVLDLDKTLTHYTDYIGLSEVMRDKDGQAYLKAWDEHDHHSVVLRETNEAGIDYFAFKVLDDETLTALEKRVAAAGVPVERIDAGVYPKSGRRIQFQIPSGHTMQLYAEKEQNGNTIPTTNPEVLPDPAVVKGMAPTRTDHVLLYGPNIPETAKFLIEALGFELTEQIIDDESGTQVSAFLACSNKAHDIAFVSHPEPGKLHHVSFNLPSVQDIYHAGDIIGKYRISTDIGPTRHGITRGATIYFFDPSGNRNEVFAGGYIRYPDMPVLTWMTSNLGSAIFYVDQELNENFLGVVT